MNSIMKAAQTLSGEIVLGRLLEKMMRIVIENAGAQKGFLLLEKEGEWLIEAEGDVDRGEVRVMQSVSIVESDAVCAGIIHYVARTRESVVLDDAVSEGDFSREAHIRKHGTRSVLCIPLLHKGELNSILYLENSLTTNAFTPKRVELLEILASQAAISVENASLYAGLEQKVAERTEELNRALEALWGEMELAKKIQTALIPGEPGISGYEIAASCDPAEEVGGDYYDFISVGKHDWIVVGDVSGHGVPAGLVMMMVQTAIHTVLTGNPDVPPSRLLSVINRTVYENIEKMGESKHMTIVVLAGGKDGKFSFAGLHEDILIRRAATGKVEAVETDGMWIGLMDDISEMLSDGTLRLEPGDCMVLFTDGITEARDREDSLFGDERLIRIIEESGDGPASQVHRNIITALEPWEKPDDVTLVVVKRT
ncbi:SpoIIE family protein phosphatase [Desulfobacterales bacterium HSG2]|nr:SpoIIE family protein phosphatase [Desulfobacterales bacterium HSG2]